MILSTTPLPHDSQWALYPRILTCKMTWLHGRTWCFPLNFIMWDGKSEKKRGSSSSLWIRWFSIQDIVGFYEISIKTTKSPNIYRTHAMYWENDGMKPQAALIIISITDLHVLLIAPQVRKSHQENPTHFYILMRLDCLLPSIPRMTIRTRQHWFYIL